MGGSSSSAAAVSSGAHFSGAGLGVFLLFLLLGGGMIAFGLIFHLRGNARFAAAKGWLPVDALIKLARVDRHEQYANNMTTHSYRPVAQYSYQAGGAEREGTRVFLVARSDWNSRNQAQAWLDAYPQGAIGRAWYDPANPADSALILNKPSLWMAIVLVGTGVFLLLAGLFVLVRMMAG